MEREREREREYPLHTTLNAFIEEKKYKNKQAGFYNRKF